MKCSNAARQSQEALIRMKYGGLLVNVYERNLAPASMLVDITNIDELAKLAERHSTVILPMALNFIHYYMVQCNRLTYRYIFSAGTDTIDGAGGDDCILGSAGNDSLTDSDGNDVCIGSAGRDTFTDCEVESQ